MPQWFLSLWIAARDILGPTTFNVASGILSYIGYGASKGMTALDATGVAAPLVKEQSIDVQANRFTGYGARGARDVVIGNNSGSKGLGAGGNVIIGSLRLADGANSAVILNDWPLHEGKSVLVGTDVLLKNPFDTTRNSFEADVAVGSNIKMTAGGSVAVGTSINGSGEVFLPFVALGQNLQCGNITLETKPLTSMTAVGFNNFAETSNLAPLGYSNLGAVGVNLHLYVDGVDSISALLLGVGGELVFAAASPRVTTGMGLVRLSTASTVGHVASIDVFAGTTTNTSLVLLGSDFGTVINNADQGANAAYRFAFGDQGKVLDAGVGTPVTIPDNCSTFILTGSGTRTITFPVNPFDGQFLTLSLGTAHTALTLAGGTGRPLVDGTITVTAGSAKTWVFHKTGTGTGVWYRHA